MKKTLAISMMLLVFILFGCADKSGNVTPTINNSSINNTDGTSDTLETTGSMSIKLIYSAGTDGNVLVSGQLPSGVIVSAEVLSSRDLHSPGDASTYQIQAIPFSEQDRLRFVQDGWTLTDERTEQSSIGMDYFDGISYYDTYSSDFSESVSLITLPPIIHFRTSRGALFMGLATSMGEFPAVIEDFAFSSMDDAYLQASSFLSNAGFQASECFDVYRIPYTWLEQAEKLAEYYGDDTSLYEQLYPEGFTTTDNAYLFYLRQSIDDLPILSASVGTLLQNGEKPVDRAEIVSYPMNGMEVLVTDQGVECARSFYTYEVDSVSETNNICNFETALEAVTDAIYSGNTNDGLFSNIGSQISGTITVEKAELGYLPLLKKDEFIGKAIPCWIFRIVWEDTNSSSPIKVKVEDWAAVNAYTGEYIPATTSSEGI